MLFNNSLVKWEMLSITWRPFITVLFRIAAATYEDLQDELKAAKCKGQSRYAVYDAEYTLTSGQQRNKIFFVLW